MASMSESMIPSKNCRSHLITENSSRSIEEPVAKNAISDGDRSIKREKPKVLLSKDNPSELSSCRNIDRYTFSGEYILKSVRKDSLLSKEFQNYGKFLDEPVSVSGKIQKES